ncbi:hypothetical protein [Pseudidiomarina insulisalsae]|uniref:Uncharacterized protein n=1 Tax=Pseudidiomarina insulisalsae TaxID=575789 RepID=A0A432YQN2_9GAMM|nr:hypothetical protein [Pseudidiomarina insulisalsae]RUO63657.1 hypothetical protein CWI71_00915 [Pseudidiomarina insulisalsae]
MADAGICLSDQDKRVTSKKVQVPYSYKYQQEGYQYLLEIDNEFGGLSFSSASLVVGELSDPEFFVSVNLTADGQRNGSVGTVIISKTLLKDAKLIAEYGNFCGGSGWEVIYPISEEPTSPFNS